MKAGEISEKLAEYAALMDAQADWISQAEGELRSDNPQVTENGVLIAEGDAARAILESLVKMLKTMGELGPLLFKSYSH